MKPGGLYKVRFPPKNKRRLNITNIEQDVQSGVTQDLDS